ncbi:MAG: type II secretion system F family protein [Oleiphilaceae bacterium]|nr:type II secretion system F family protein [Oleiphilaceae bacterium]
MTNSLLIAVIGVAGFSFLLACWAIRSFNSGIARHRDMFKETAQANLADAFIFIEPEKLYIGNMIFLVAGFLITWFLSGAWPLALVVAFLGSLLPRFAYRLIKNRRESRFLQDLPDALGALASMMRSGASFNIALEHLVSEISGPIAQEFGLLQRELRMGVDYSTALESLCQRMPLAELQLVASGITISREVGGELSETLARLGETIRRKLEMEGKIKALTAQGKYQGMVMAALPVFLALAIYQIEPVAMARLFTEPIGWATCAIVVVFEFLGYHFIKKIVSIDV